MNYEQRTINHNHLTEMHRQRENGRLARKAQASYPQHSTRTVFPLLAQLGRHLTDLGQALQGRYQPRPTLRRLPNQR